MRFASLAPRCGTPPRLLPLGSASASSRTATGPSKPAAAAPALNPAPIAKPTSEEWLQHARGCGAL